MRKSSLSGYQTLSSIVFILAALLITAPLAGAEFEKVLLPLYTADTPGSFGSVFASSLTVFSTAQRTIGARIACPVTTCPVGKTVLPDIVYADDDLSFERALTTNPGLFLRVIPDASTVTFFLRVWDKTRETDRWGTQIPLVRERDLKTTTASLVPLPTRADFRLTIRLYDFDATPSSNVRLRVYPAVAAPVAPLAERDVILEAPTDYTNAFHPGYAMLTDIQAWPELAGVTSVRIDIEPVTPGLRFWGFASITNNTTQEITTIFPN